MENIDLDLVNWSRAQFALTAIYHWLFIPLTLGLTVICAVMESLYYKTGSEVWKKTTKFWMKLFGINFALGVATGIILEFQFGTNWSNYSWFVGDIFGAPLAIEGIFAFFMESTFIAVMFFGWGRVSKRFHLISTWLTAVGANLSAYWILVANAWMQNPVGMTFNPDTARNEMTNFAEVALSPVAINKFIHTVSSGFITGSVFVIGVSAWFLLKNREIIFAKKSIKIAAIFGLFATLIILWSGDGSSRDVAKYQPMKLAAAEGLYHGKTNAGLVAVGVLNSSYSLDSKSEDPFLFKIEIPSALSYLSFRDKDAFVPGITDLIEGNSQYGYISAKEKMERGRFAIDKLRSIKEAQKSGNKSLVQTLTTEYTSKEFVDNYFQYFGYGYIKDTNELIPNVTINFYSFHLMVMLGGLFIALFIAVLLFVIKGTIEKQRWLLWISVWSIPLVYLASVSGWVVAEVGRQPWVVQDLLPASAAVSQISSRSVQVTFWLFATLFTALLIAEIRIMTKQIKVGPKIGGAE